MNYAFSPRFIIIYILFLSVLVDIFYGVLDFYGLAIIPFSMLFRITIMAMFVVVVFKENTFQSWFVKTLIVVWLFFMCLWISRQGSIPLFLNLNTFLKVIYPMSLTLILSFALQQAYSRGENLLKLMCTCVIAYGAISALSIVFSFVTGIGRLTYGPWAFGIKSFFVGGNDIGLAMLISLVFIWVRFWQQGRWLNGALIVLVTFGISMIGSRAAWGGVVGVTFSFVMAFVMFKKSRSNKTRFLKVVILSTLISVGSYVTKLVYDNFEELSFHIEKFTQLMEGVSPRVYLEDAAIAVLKRRDVVDDVIGEGVTFNYRLYEELSIKRLTAKVGRELSPNYRSVEQDFLDLYGLYGALLTICILSFHFYYWFMAMRLFFQKRSVEFFGCFMALTLFLFHGLVAGHALYAPQVCTLAATIYSYLHFRKKHQIKEENF
ncbi:MAG: O-antigen ligase family protein [Algicola sp.]|nr:O-antigen ligase family protein [Algicola sp.]